MPTDHYENFPVASLLLPKQLRPAVAQVYWFARSADDLADEGDAAPQAREAALAGYRRQLDALASGAALDPACEPARFAALGRLIADWPLDFQPFYDLLSAFTQDVWTTRYASYTAVLDYCSRSANPVGRIMLALYRLNTPQRQASADAICSALQLINFLQDVAIDARKGRIYLPLEDLERFQVDADRLLAGDPGPHWQELMRFECARSEALMRQGAALVHQLPGRIGLEMRFVVQGGLRILERLRRVDYDVFARRPTLTRSDWAHMAMRALTMSGAPA